MVRRDFSDRRRRSRRALGWLRLAVALILAAGVSALVASPASAKATVLLASEPQARQTVDDEPGWVTVAFDRDVDSSVAKMIVQGPDGDNMTTGPLIVEGTNVTSQLRDDLPQGTYTVHYRINAPDGDVQGGAFQFAYGTGSFTSLPDAKWSGSAHEPAILRGTDPNATTEPPKNQTSKPPDVEVERSDGSTQTADPGQSKPPKKSAGTTQGSGGKTTTTNQPTEQPTDASAPPVETPTATTGSASRLPLIVGGAVLLIAIGAGAVALGLRARGGGSHSGGGDGADGGSSGLTG